MTIFIGSQIIDGITIYELLLYKTFLMIYDGADMNI